jgi:hypothetical protein
MIAVSGLVNAEKSETMMYLHCGALGVKDVVKKDVFETPQVHMFFNNQSKNYFLVIDFDENMMHRYPYKCSSDMSPLLDDSRKISRAIIPANSQVLEKPGVAYFSWVSKNPITSFLDEYVYIASKTEMLGKKGYLGGILTKVETSMITSAPEPIPQVIKPSVVVSQHLCSKVFDFSNKGDN